MATMENPTGVVVFMPGAIELDWQLQLEEVHSQRRSLKHRSLVGRIDATGSGDVLKQKGCTTVLEEWSTYPMFGEIRVGTEHGRKNPLHGRSCPFASCSAGAEHALMQSYSLRAV